MHLTVLIWLAFLSFEINPLKTEKHWVERESVCGVSRAESCVKEWELDQCRSWSTREERELLGSYHTRLNQTCYLKELISGESKKESEEKRAKEDRQPMFDLIWHERGYLFYLFLTGMRIFPSFLDSVRLPRIARIIRIYTENKLRWSGLRK